MSDTGTILIPADLGKPIEVVDNIDPIGLPVHVSGASENPDEFCLAFYPVNGRDSLEENHRASIMAMATSEDAPTLGGDLLLVAPGDLLQRIYENDQKFQQHRKTIAAFRAWLVDYAEANNLDTVIVFESVSEYTEHINRETQESIRREHAEKIAGLMGLDPEQVGVFFV